jgi:hypothetical protein
MLAVTACKKDAPQGMVVKGVVDASDISGSDDPLVRSGVEGHYQELGSCYDTALRDNPQVNGKVEVRFSIVDGRVSNAATAANTTGSASLASCINTEVESWVFPTTVNASVTWPFVFKLAPGQ